MTEVVNFRVDDDGKKTANRLKTVLIKKYGKLHGVWSEVMTQAMEQVLAVIEVPTHTQTPANITQFHRRLASIYRELPNNGHISYGHLEKVITKHAGADSRTLLKYRRAMVVWDLLVINGGGYRCNPECEWVKVVGV